MKLFFRLLKYVFNYKRHIILIVLCNILYSVFSVFSLALIVPFLSVIFGITPAVHSAPTTSFSVDSMIQWFYYYMDVVINKFGSVYALVYIANVMIVMTFIYNLFRYLGQFFLAPIRAGVLNNIRKDIYRAFTILPLSFYSRYKKGDLLNRMGSDVQEVEWSIISSLQTFARDPLLILVYLIALFKINYQLTLITLVLLPFLGYLTTIIGRAIQKNSKSAQKLLGKLSSLYDEAIGGLKIIKGYNAIDYANRKFQQTSKEHYKINTKIFRINELGGPLIETLSIITMVFVLMIGTSLISKGEQLNGTHFVLFIVVFARMIPSAKKIVTVIYTLKKGLPSAQRIFEILDADEVIVEDPNPIAISEIKNEIVFKDLYFDYTPVASPQDCKVLKGINLRIKKGQTIALVGASGSGKSTIVDLIPRFYDPSFGSIEIDGIDIRKLKIMDLRALFGIVTQDVTLFNDTVFNNITFGKKDIPREKVIQAAKMAHADSFIMQMENGYDTLIGDRGMNLSGGERQRISIARALLIDPEVYIFDEATSALDNESEAIIQSAINEILQEKTAIIVAHRLTTIQNADQILFIEEGNVSESGTHQELLELKGKYYQYYAHQNLFHS